MKKLFLFASIILMISAASCRMKTERLFTGSFTKSGENGFNIFDMNLRDGTIKLVSSYNAGPDPSYFCISKKHGYFYAANEVEDFLGKKAGGVTTLSYNAGSGTVNKIHEMTVPNGGPAFISLSKDEDFLLFANYPGGSVAVVKLDEKGIPATVSDTILYEPAGEKVSHPHMIAPGPEGRIYVTDLGLDRVVIYNLGKDGRLTQMNNGIVNLAQGAGPRHFTFSSDGKKMYVICELNSTITVFDVNTDGGLSEIQTLSTLGEGFQGKSFCADIHISKDGKYLYGSNRGENTIATFSIGPDGKLANVGRTTCGGDWPRNFVIDPSGKFLLVGNERSGNISIFTIDEKTGVPRVPGKDYKIVPPGCLKFMN
jgi:6-phosphogluconolactonase